MVIYLYRGCWQNFDYRNIDIGQLSPASTKDLLSSDDFSRSLFTTEQGVHIID